MRVVVTRLGDDEDAEEVISTEERLYWPYYEQMYGWESGDAGYAPVLTDSAGADRDAAAAAALADLGYGVTADPPVDGAATTDQDWAPSAGAYGR